MLEMTGAKTSTDERSRDVGSTSVGDCLRRVVVSTFLTSSAVVGDSWDSVHGTGVPTAMIVWFSNLPAGWW